MSVYLKQDEIKTGVLVKAKSFWSGEPIPAIIVERYDQDFVRVLDTENERSMLNVLYLEPWK